MEVEVATRRTRLATERTYLAWWRSGLTALAVGLAAGKLVPELSSGASWPYELLGAGYALLDLITFFTVGPKEARAWTVRHGARAPEAAGVIHTDFERGFIRAEVIAYDDYLACTGETGAKDAGKMRLEGKEYVVRDGDVIYFRFNV